MSKTPWNMWFCWKWEVVTDFGSVGSASN